MQFFQLEDRLDAGYYAVVEMLNADFKLMMDNCKLYNGPESGGFFFFFLRLNFFFFGENLIFLFCDLHFFLDVFLYLDT